MPVFSLQARTIGSAASETSAQKKKKMLKRRLGLLPVIAHEAFVD
jgi:hypothetical protein